MAHCDLALSFSASRQIAALPPYDLKFVRDLPNFFTSLSHIKQLSLEKHEFAVLPDLSMRVLCSAKPNCRSSLLSSF